VEAANETNATADITARMHTRRRLAGRSIAKKFVKFYLFSVVKRNGTLLANVPDANATRLTGSGCRHAPISQMRDTVGGL
jgi:hypothetical protein